MKRRIFETNIYGFIVVDTDREVIRNFVETSKEMNLRMDLLRVYDDLVKKEYPIDHSVQELAENYFKIYQNIGGSTPQSKLMNNFLIIACASLNDLDIVVSNDVKTMSSDLAIKASFLVNELNNTRLPSFIHYEDFKSEIKK